MLIYDGAIGALGHAADIGSARALELAVEAKIPGYDPLAVAGLPRPRSAASFMTECRVGPVRRAWTPITICEVP